MPLRDYWWCILVAKYGAFLFTEIGVVLFTDYNTLVIGANENEILIYDRHNPKQFLDWLTKLLMEKNIDKFKSSSQLAFINISGDKIYLSKPNFNDNDLKELLKISVLGFQVRKEE